MGRIKRLYFILLSILFIFPALVHAGTELSTSTQYPVVGTSFYVQLDLMYCDDQAQDCSNLNIHDFHSIITYDPYYFKFEKVIWLQSSGSYSDNQNGLIYINKEAGRDWFNGSALQLKFTVLHAGLSEIKIDRNGESHYTDGHIIGQSFAGIYIGAKEPNEYTRLSGLYIRNYDIQPTFNKMHTEYTLTVPANVTAIDVIAQKGDPTQTITGDGPRNIQYGDNKVHVIVKAQDGSSTTYNINVIRTDNRNGDTTLKSLTIGDTIIPIKENVYNYETTVTRSVDNVLVSARTNDPNATLIGTGRKSLNIGNNQYNLIVESSNGKRQEYTININRSTEEFAVVENSNKLRDIKVNGITLDLSDNRTEWFYGISSDIDELSINAVTESKTAVIDITGNEKLSSGVNVVEVKVTEMKNVTEQNPAKPTDSTIYRIVVYKNPIGSLIIDSLDDLPHEKDADFFYRTTNEEDSIIKKENIDTINKNNKKLYYNVVNIYNGVLYQVTLSNLEVDDDIDVSFKKISQNTYETSLPKDVEIMLNVRETYQDNINVKVYTYNKENEYKLLTDGLKVQDGYIRFTTNGDTHYVITTTSLIEDAGPLELWFRKNKNILIGILIGIVVLIIVLIIISKIRKKKTETELQY